MRLHGLKSRAGHELAHGQFGQVGQFGRMFSELPAFEPDVTSLDALAAKMIEASADNSEGDNPGVPQGFTYLGQFVDHDITFDPTALREVMVDPLSLRNFRSPGLDLDSVYGSGPETQPFLYQRADRDKLQIGLTNGQPGRGDSSIPPSQPNDLPRGPNSFALIGDPRNDENLNVAQTHLVFLKFHNKVIEGLKANTVAPLHGDLSSPFEAARELVTWHYQWVVLHDFIKRIVDQAEFDDVLAHGRRYYLFDHTYYGEPFMPVEFSVAAYRLGHSMVRNVYDYNRVFTPKPGGVTPATLDLLFSFTGLSGMGDRVPIPSDWIIDWRRFYEVEAGFSHGLSRKIDPFLAQSLANLPGVAVPNALAVRNLRRGRMLGLPTGQRIAERMGYAALTQDEIATGPDGEEATKHGFHKDTPLWYYILKEAEVKGESQRLGKVGSRIVVEVFVGLLEGDRTSYLSMFRNWTPTLPSAVAGTFTLADLLRFVDDINPIG